MEKILVSGGRPLVGTVELPSAKNSILPILAAALLAEGPVRIRQVPALGDVQTSLQLLAALGCPARREGQDLLLTPGGPVGETVPPQLMGAMRSSIYYLVPMLARGGRARLALPGGCRLGARPVDLHLAGLCAMGAQVRQLPDGLDCAAPQGLRGARYHLRFASVGATETLMMAAAAARGETVLTGVAKEPEVVDLAGFLTACGARIEGAGTGCIRVQGGPLGGCSYIPIPDRIVGQTLLCAVAACGGEVTLLRAPAGPLQPLARLLARAGAELDTRQPGQVRIASSGRLRAVGRVRTGVWPAFATDAGPLLAAAMLQAEGDTLLQETIFGSRFACAEGFARMGARLRCSGSSLFIRGRRGLRGARVAAPDLRGGAALVLAALQAEGESCITDAGHIRRGYASMERLFAPLGARIEQTGPAEEAGAGRAAG